MDRIVLVGLAFFAYHGVLTFEKEQGQPFLVDVELFLDLQAAGQTDDLALTVNYQTVYEVVKRVVLGPSQNLLESVAVKISALLLEDGKIQGVIVRIYKPQAPVGGLLQHAMVEIKRGVTS